jgi:CBS domain-containing membrane protein
MPARNSQPGSTRTRRTQNLAHVESLFRRLGLARLVSLMPPMALWAAYVFVNGFLSIGLLALLAVTTGVPFVFPSLGLTAYQLFFSPLVPSSAPRHGLIGHAIGLICDYLAFRLTRMPMFSVLASRDFDWRAVLAAALSLAGTAALMILARTSHPPAGATTFIVSLGIITEPSHLAVMEVAVLVLIVQAFCINRLAGIPYPVWQELSPGAADEA